jgi:hypothetical protein
MRWLDRTGALLIGGVALWPGMWALRLFLAAIEFAPRGDGLGGVLFGIGAAAYLVITVVVLGFAVAAWRGHIAGRMLALAASLGGAVWFGAQALLLYGRSPSSLADETRINAAVAAALGGATALLLISVVSSVRDRHREN